MRRSGISLLVLAAAFAAALVLVPNVLLMLFAGVLLAVFLRTGGGWIAARTGLGGAWGVGIFMLAIVLAFTAFGLLVAPRVVEEIHALVDRLPELIEEMRARIEEFPLGERLVRGIRPAILGEGGGLPTGALGSVFGIAGNMVVILFVGIYGAIDPGRYRRPLLALVAPSLRPRGEEVIDDAAATLRHWLFAQISAMTAVGVLTSLGLWLLGIPLAFALGTIAGLLAFIPNLGPVLALLPGLMLGMAEGGNTVWWVLAVYIGVQFLESYFITPLLQQETVELPPGFILGMQLLFATLFGLLGLALATPAAALLLSLTRTLYVHDTLEAEPADPRVQPAIPRSSSGY
jgi:predicted PurR-regulated permease PerM